MSVLMDLDRKLLESLERRLMEGLDSLRADLSERIDSARDELLARLDETNGRLDGTNGRLDETNGRLDETNGRLDETNGRLVETNRRLDDTNASLQTALTAIEETNIRLNRFQREYRAGFNGIMKFVSALEVDFNKQWREVVGRIEKLEDRDPPGSDRGRRRPDSGGGNGRNGRRPPEK